MQLKMHYTGYTPRDPITVPRAIYKLGNGRIKLLDFANVMFC